MYQSTTEVYTRGARTLEKQRRKERARERNVGWTSPNVERARWLYRAGFYAWSARRSETPVGNDPVSGDRWNAWNPSHVRLGRAMDAAAARECFRIARGYRNPLPTDTMPFLQA